MRKAGSNDSDPVLFARQSDVSQNVFMCVHVWSLDTCTYVRANLRAGIS